MALYTFYIIKSNSPVASIDVADLNDDDAARAHACSLCEAHNGCVRIEIWQGDRLIADRPCSSAAAV